MARRKKEESILDEMLKERDPFLMPMGQELTKNLVVYSKEVNNNRAFAHVLPGIKPVVGHAIWAMAENGETHNKPYTKSINVSGQVTAYSPHGDSYGTLVRLAQDFTYHQPYLDGHGSFGSVIGGPTAAAPRYTGLRLTEFIEDVLLYNKKLLNMGLNYTEEKAEPILKDWVALLPLLFMSNIEGIGYTVSNSWSSGNLKEFRDQLVNYLKTGKVDCSQIYPDFPTGGIIINKKDMKELYETGKGTIRLRGETEIDGDTIKIKSLPFQKYPEDFMTDIKDYVTRSPNNTIVDVSNRCGDDNFLIEVDCEAGTAEYVLEVLFRKTCLQVSISDEHKAVTAAGRPELITFPQYMKIFVDANIELVKKEAQLNIDEITDRLELIDGLLNALDIIDEIIATIKKSKSMEDAKHAIMGMKKYKFTERQADFIVHTHLGRLANLEQVKLQDEKKDLDKRKAENEDLLVNPKSQKKFFLNRFNKLVDKYGWDRKTKLEDIEMTDLRVAVEKPTKLRVKKEFIVVLTDANTLKRVEVTKFRATDEDSKNIKVQGNQKVTLVSNKGNMYKVMSNAIDKCMPTASGTSIVDIRPEIKNEKILAIYDEAVDMPYIYFVTKNGLGKMGKVKDSLKISKAIGATVCGLKDDDDEVIAIKLLNDGQKIELVTNTGRKEVVDPGKPQGRGAGGKRIIFLKKGEEITEVHSV